MSNKKITNQVNEFDETVSASKSFFDNHKKSILYGGGAVLAIVIACLLIHQFYIVPRNNKANEALFAAEAQFRSGNYDKALNGDSVSVGFLQVIDQYGCTKAANLAKMYAGICQANLGNYAEAVKLLEDFSGQDDAMISPAAMGALGDCYAQLDQKGKAASTLEKAAKKADSNTLSPVYLVQAGQIYEALGQAEKALACYETVKSSYKQSYLSSEVDKYIERLK